MAHMPFNPTKCEYLKVTIPLLPCWHIDSIVNNKAINVKCLRITTKPQKLPSTNKMVMLQFYQTNSYLNMPPLHGQPILFKISPNLKMYKGTLHFSF